jgi:hypothetical protein
MSIEYTAEQIAAAPITVMSPASWFYIRMSQHLNHGHQLQYELVSMADGLVQIRAPRFAGDEMVDLLCTHIAQAMQGHLRNEAQEYGLLGMTGWERCELPVGPYDSVRQSFYHRTATGRLALWAARSASGKTMQERLTDEIFGFDVYSGEGLPVASLRWDGTAGWHARSKTAKGEPVEYTYAMQQNDIRPDRYADIVAALYDDMSAPLLPGKPLHAYHPERTYGVSMAIRRCLDGDIPTPQPQEERAPVTRRRDDEDSE